MTEQDQSVQPAEPTVAQNPDSTLQTELPITPTNPAPVVDDTADNEAAGNLQQDLGDTEQTGEEVAEDVKDDFATDKETVHKQAHAILQALGHGRDEIERMFHDLERQGIVLVRKLHV